MKVSSILVWALWLSALLASAAAARSLPQRDLVVSAHAAASAAGQEVLAAGGNAFDAAVAVSAVLGLVEPESSGIGGGGFFLLHLAAEDRQVFVDARERAPLAAQRDMYLDAQGQPLRRRTIDGALAAAIPGLPAALVHVAERYGRLPLARSLAPAIQLAEDGWEFSRKNHAMLGWRAKLIAADPGAAALFMLDGELAQIGSRLRNPDYAATLRRLVEHGHDGFYRGDYAAGLVSGVRALGGIWSERDLAEYRVVEREPIRIDTRGFRIVTAPPPSSGGIALAEALRILDGIDYRRDDPVLRVHVLTEAMRRAYRDRAVHLGDPDHVEVPVQRLLDGDYLAGLRAGIRLDRATPSASLAPAPVASERPDTTHFSIIDRAGNLAAVTQTINLPYGAAVVVPGTGFLLNNEMDDFSVKPGVPNAFGLVGDAANAIAPGKRPLSSMSPSLLFGPDQVAVVGTPGGSRIISMVLLALLELMEGSSAAQAAALPRFHHQYLPDQLAVEPDGLPPEVLERLRGLGHRIEIADEIWGNMQIARWNPHTGEVDAGNDPRWAGIGAPNGQANPPAGPEQDKADESEKPDASIFR